MDPVNNRYVWFKEEYGREDKWYLFLVWTLSLKNGRDAQLKSGKIGSPQKTAVAVAQETITVIQRMLIYFPPILSNERANKQEQRRLRLMEISDQRVGDFKLVARNNDHARVTIQFRLFLIFHPTSDRSQAVLNGNSGKRFWKFIYLPLTYTPIVCY